MFLFNFIGKVSTQKIFVIYNIIYLQQLAAKCSSSNDHPSSSNVTFEVSKSTVATFNIHTYKYKTQKFGFTYYSSFCKRK